MEQRCNTILSLGLVYRLLFSLSAPLAQSASLALASSPLPSSSRFLSGCLAPSRPGGDAGTSVLGAASPRAATYLGGRVSSTLGGSTPPNAPRLRRGTPYAQARFRLLGQLPLRRLGVAEEGGKIGVPSCFGIHSVHFAVLRPVQGVVEDAYKIVVFIVGT